MRTIIPHNAKLVPENANCVFKGKIYSIHQWQQQMYDGSFEIFEMLKRPDTVKTLIIKDDKIVVSHEHQPHVGEFRDIPGGRHDHEGETELQAAQRETLEETGFICKHWKLIHAQQSHSKIEQFLYIFLAWDIIEQHEQQLDAGEKITIELYTLEDFKNLSKEKNNRSANMKILDDINTIEELLALPAYQ